MPNRQTHVLLGTLAGCGVAVYRAGEQELMNRFLEAVGGAVCGYAGSRIPDVVEPASWPGHRQLAHSAITGGVVAFSIYELLAGWENLCRSKAELYSQRKATEGINILKDTLFALLEIILRVVAGFLSGLGAGYLSHLALDGTTRSGIPFLQ